MQTSVGTASMVHGNTSLSQIGMMGSPPTAQPQVTSPGIPCIFFLRRGGIKCFT